MVAHNLCSSCNIFTVAHVYLSWRFSISDVKSPRCGLFQTQLHSSPTEGMRPYHASAVPTPNAREIIKKATNINSENSFNQPNSNPIQLCSTSVLKTFRRNDIMQYSSIGFNELLLYSSDLRTMKHFSSLKNAGKRTKSTEQAVSCGNPSSSTIKKTP